MSRTIFTALFLTFLISAFAQTNVRPLPTNINRPSLNLFAPFISGDGETLIYLSDYTDDGHHFMYWTTRRGVAEWTDGKEINRLINRPGLNFRGGYSLSFDGDLLLFTSRKSGIGGFDLWYSERKGNDWLAPKNFGKPVNSASNDGSPSLSADGEYLYFMRCETMSEYGGATGCRLMVTRRNHRGWDEPVPLPDNINTGNSQSPRILADDQTLIFSSDAMGGKGNLDLFMTRKTDTGWSDPVPLDFINTEFHNAFISIPAKGRYLYQSVKGRRDFQLVETLIPEEFRPRRVMRIKGAVTHNKYPVEDAKYVVFDVENRKRLYQHDIPPSGEFSFVLPEGSNYDLAITSSDPSLLYFAKPYLLTNIGRRDKEQLRVELKSLSPGELVSSSIHFVPFKSTLDNASDFEIRRLTRLAGEHNDMNIRIEVMQTAYREDSVFSDPDLTEIITDTLWTPPADTLLMNPLDSDTLRMSFFNADSVFFTHADSLLSDSLSLAYPANYVTIRHTFHNDRTVRQAKSIIEALTEKGIAESRITWKAVIRREELTKTPMLNTGAGEMTGEDPPADEDPPEQVRVYLERP